MPADQPLLSIMLVNWNTREMTLACLRSIYAQTTEAPFEVILVDNGSTDGSAEAIAAEFPQVRLMAERVNHGFARATNLSVERARGELILLLNTDTIVLDRAIDRLVAFARAVPDAKIWGGRTVFADGSLNPSSAWGRPTPWSVFSMASGLSLLFRRSEVFSPETYGNWQRDTRRQVDIVQGSFLLVTKQLWDDLGGFDPAFFMFGEEVDFCLRARALGARPQIDPSATIIHYGGQSTRLFADRIVYVLGGRIGLIDRHFSPSMRGFGRRMTLFWALWRSLAYRCAALLFPRFADNARQWTEGWQRRAEWRNGPPAAVAEES